MRAAGARRSEWRRFGVVAVILLGLGTAGCSTGPQPAAMTAGPRGPTVAFESIDGPPESIFRKLVQSMSEEASTRQIAVVSRESPAQYRVRGYVAALVESRRATVIAWVWDVYDSNQRRALRITGEERIGAAGRGTWAAADDQVLRRIARAGMDRLAVFLAAPDAEPIAPAAPEERGPRVAEDTAPVPQQRPAAAGFVATLAYAGHDR